MEEKIVRGGLFKVKSSGEIYRRKESRWEPAKIYNLTPNKGRGVKPEYKVVSTTYNGKQTHYYVHRLIAEAFVPNPENKTQVFHKDGNSLNNDPSNLIWVTPKERAQLSIELGRSPKLEDSGRPCIQCGELTAKKDGICPRCKQLEKQYQTQTERIKNLEEKFKNVDVNTLSKRELIIVDMRSAGSTLQQIGDRLGVTREYVRQIEQKLLGCNTQSYNAKELIGKDYMSLKEIKSIRHMMGIKQRELAFKLNIADVTYRKMEADPQEFKVKHIKKLSEILDIKIEI
jgi:transcriptional regulator with XRE-family HTH domain/phage FluMu protein Com